MVLMLTLSKRRQYALLGIFMLLGVGTLLPFNVAITERDFWGIRAHCVPTWQWAADNVENLLVIVFQIWCGSQSVLLPLMR